MSSNPISSRWRNRRNTLLSRAGAVLRSPRWHLRAAWAIGAWLLVWALAYAAVPLVVKSQLERLGSEKLGRQVRVGAVDFKPWSLELTVHDLAVAKTASAAAQPASVQAVPQLKIRRFYIDMELASLLRLAPVADALVFEGSALSMT